MEQQPKSPVKDVIKLLLSKTQDNEIEWSRYQTTLFPAKGIDGGVFICIYLKYTLALYKKQSRVIDIWPISSTDIYPMSGSAVDKIEYILCLYDKKNREILYHFPDSPLIIDLYNVVEFKTSKIEKFMKDILEYNFNAEEDETKN